MRTVSLVVFAALLVGAAGPAGATRLRRDQVPQPLRPWVDWVLHDHLDELCPTVHGEQSARRCEWPSRLVLELDDRGGRFVQGWYLERPGRVPLPGDGERWTFDVRVDGAPETRRRACGCSRVLTP